MDIIEGAKLRSAHRMNPFADWNVSQRYAHQSQFDVARTTPHQTGANQVRQLIKKAEWEGLI